MTDLSAAHRNTLRLTAAQSSRWNASATSRAQYIVRAQHTATSRGVQVFIICSRGRALMTVEPGVAPDVMAEVEESELDFASL